MELGKARKVLQLVYVPDKQIRGLREIKKRLCLDKANIVVFR